MPTDWGDNIVLAHLSDEPELSEEFAALFANFADGKPRHVALDFSNVSYLNSSHLAQLLRLRKHAQEANTSLVLCGMNDDVLNVMRLSRLDSLFRFASDPLTALAGLQIDNTSLDDSTAGAS